MSLERKESVQQNGQRIVDLILRVASGEKTKSEALVTPPRDPSRLP